MECAILFTMCLTIVVTTILVLLTIFKLTMLFLGWLFK